MSDFLFREVKWLNLQCAVRRKRLSERETIESAAVKSHGRSNPGGSVSNSAQAAMRGLTRHFRAAFARKCSVCPRIAPKDQSGRQRWVASAVDCKEFVQTL